MPVLSMFYGIIIRMYYRDDKSIVHRISMPSIRVTKR